MVEEKDRDLRLRKEINEADRVAGRKAEDRARTAEARVKHLKELYEGAITSAYHFEAKVRGLEKQLIGRKMQLDAAIDFIRDDIELYSSCSACEKNTILRINTLSKIESIEKSLREISERANASDQETVAGGKPEEEDH
jgi:hypothetical protein